MPGVAGNGISSPSPNLLTPPIARPLTNTPDSWNTAVNGNWSTAADWSAGVPTISSDVTISVAGTYTVTIAAAATSNSVTLNNATAKLTDNSALTVATNLAITAGIFTLGSSGIINGGTLSTGASGSFVSAGGTLNGIVDQGTISMSGAGANLTIEHGFTGTGTINETGNGALLYSNDTETWNSATLNIGNNATYAYLYLEEAQTGAATLTLGSQFSIVQGGRVARINIDPQGNGANTLINKGTISAGVSAGNFTIYGQYAGDVFTNQGTINVSNGDIFDASNVVSFSNAGLINATGAKTVLDFGGAWSNAGSIAISSGATANLGGTFSLAALSSLSNSAGQLNITGTLQNAGTTLTVGTGSADGTVGLSGTINGGTIVDAGGGLASQSGTLSGVTYQGTLTLLNSTTLNIENGLNVTSGGSAGTINDTGIGSLLYFLDTQTLDNATLNLGSASSPSYIYIEENVGTASTLTLGTHLNLVQSGKYAQINIDPGGYGTNALINKGAITAGYSAGSFTILGEYGSDSFINQGSISVSNGVTFDTSNVITFINTGLITASGTKTVIDLGGAWSNAGSIAIASGATANLGGTFSLGAFSSLSNSAGQLNITGTLLNAGTTLTVGTGSAAGTVGLSGTINGGTIVDAGGGLASQSGTLSGVTYQGTLALLNNTTVYIASGLNVSSGGSAGTINDTGAAAFIDFLDTQTLDNATLNLGSASTSYIYIDEGVSSVSTLTLGSHLNLVQSGKNAQINIDPSGYGTNALVNKGAITAAVSTGSFTILGQYTSDSFTNQGSISVSNGDIFNASNVMTFVNTGIITAAGVNTVLDLGGAWSNAGSIAISGGATANLGGTFSLAAFSSLSNSAGQLNITGTLQNTGTTLTLGTGSAAGTIGFSGAILGGTIVDTGGGLLAQTGTLSGVSYDGALNLSQANANIVLEGSNIFTGLNGTGLGTINLTGSNAQLLTGDSTTLDHAVINFGSANVSDTIYLAPVVSNNDTLILGSSLQLTQSSAGSSDTIDLYSYPSAGTLINQGTITASASSGHFTVYNNASQIASFTNQGTVAVSNGDVFAVSGVTTLTNQGVINVSGGGTFDLSTVTRFSNLSAGTLSGIYSVGAASLLQIANNTSVTAISGTLTLSGAGSVVEGVNSTSGKQVTIDQKLTSISSTGVLNLLANRSFSASAAFTDNGVLQLGGGTFTAIGFTLGTGAHLTGFGALATPLANAGSVEASVGTLALTGAVTGAGALQVDAGATLDIKTSAAGGTASFSGMGGVLKLESAASFTDIIANYAAGDVINIGASTATAASITGTILSITLTGGSVLNETLSAAPINEHIGISADGHSLTAYNLAQPATHTPEPVAFANHHVGDSVSTAITLANTATPTAYSEALDASIAAATGAATGTGSFSSLAAGASNGASLLVGLNTATAGALTGTDVITLASDGTGIDGYGATSLGTQVVNVTGSIYAYAQGSLANGGTIVLANTHVGQAANGFLALTNSAAAGGYSEALDASLGNASAGYSASGTVNALGAQGTSNALQVGYTAGASGAYSGTATLGLTSDGTAIGDGLGATTLANQAVTITGAAYAYAAPMLASSTINLGIVHVGQADGMALSLTNGALANLYSEALDAYLSNGSAGITANGSLTGLLAGQTNGSSLLLQLATSASGSFSGTALLNLISDGAVIGDGLGTTALGGQTITISGVVDNYALAAFQDPGGPAIAGSGTQYAINLGSVAQGSAAEVLSLGVLNGASGLSDLLQGMLSVGSNNGFTNSGFGSFSGLGAGQGEHSQSITLSTSTAGTFTETIVLSSSGTNASGYNGALATETLTITGVIAPVGSNSYTLSAGPNTIAGADGGDVFIAAAASINSRDSITGGNGANVIQLTGGGQFDLGAPKIFANVPTITAYEGQAASGAIADSSQVVYLRDGSNENLSVVAGTPVKGDVHPETITIYSSNATNSIQLATGTDSVFLAQGNDTVILGGLKNTVVAGGGTALVQATAAFAAASVVGTTTGSTTLEITTAGTVTLNAADTDLTVRLDGASRLVLDKLSFVTAIGSSGADTIAAGGVSQTLTGGGGADALTGYTGGGDTFLDSSANLNGITIANWTSGDIIDLTDMNTASLKAPKFGLGKLTVTDGSHSAVITVKGLAGATLTTSNFVTLGSDGHGGSLLGYHA